KLHKSAGQTQNMFFCSSVEKKSQTKTATPTETPPQNTPFLALFAKMQRQNILTITISTHCIFAFCVFCISHYVDVCFHAIKP
ncbi:MAG: hypothetical protein J6Q43_01955, partial [Bacteroidaceae bacterium]|nr:hypothetical protein [Bacteroidaceae bacterium]